jgi:hypothetical protein
MLNSTDKIIIGYYNSSLYIDSSIFKLINYLIINNSNDNPNVLLIIKNVIINSLEKIEDNFYGQENVICTLLILSLGSTDPTLYTSFTTGETLPENYAVSSTLTCYAKAGF